MGASCCSKCTHGADHKLGGGSEATSPSNLHLQKPASIMTAPLRASLSHSKRFYVSLASLFHPSPPSPPQAHTPTKPQLLTLSKALAQISPHLPLCPHCDFPISNALMHSCEDMREAQEDHTGESKYRMELPAAQGVGKPGLDSWYIHVSDWIEQRSNLSYRANLFKTRKFTQARTTRDQRLLTRELTYPITVAQFMYGAKPYSYPLQTKEGTKILERKSQLFHSLPCMMIIGMSSKRVATLKSKRVHC